MNILQGDCIEVRVPETALYKDVTQTCSAALAFMMTHLRQTRHHPTQL